MALVVILTTIALYWGLFANLTVTLTFAIPTVLCELVAHLIIERGEK